jgi:hypothetical protein
MHHSRASFASRQGHVVGAYYIHRPTFLHAFPTGTHQRGTMKHGRCTEHRLVDGCKVAYVAVADFDLKPIEGAWIAILANQDSDTFPGSEQLANKIIAQQTCRTSNQYSHYSSP